MDEEKLTDLAESIKRVGILQPLIVTLAPNLDGEGSTAEDVEGAPGAQSAVPRYEIVAGHRRYLASLQAHFDTVPVLVFDAKDEALEAAKLHENIYREDLTAAEEGWFYCELVEKHKLTENELCRMVQHTASYIYARMDLVRGDTELSKMVAERKVNFSVARELLKCDDPGHRRYLMGLAAESGASTRVVQGWVRQWQAAKRDALPLPDAAPATAEETPIEANTLKCFFCGRAHDPENLKLLYVHWYEYDSIMKLLRDCGVPVVGA